MIFYMFTLQFLIDMCDHWHFAVEKYVRSKFFFFNPLSYNKSRPHKNMFFGSFNTTSSEFWGFLGSPGFQKSPVTWETPAAEWVKRYINHWCHFAGGKKTNALAPYPNSCLIGVWCCCMYYAVQKWAFPCRWCDFRVKSRATCCWGVGPLRSDSTRTPWCRCGSGCGCCAGGIGSSG